MASGKHRYQRAKPIPAWTYVKPLMLNKARMVIAGEVACQGSKVNKKCHPKKVNSPNHQVCAKRTILRYQTPFIPKIEGMDPPKKFTPPMFTLYDGKSDPRSHISYFKQ